MNSMVPKYQVTAAEVEELSRIVDVTIHFSVTSLRVVDVRDSTDPGYVRFAYVYANTGYKYPASATENGPRTYYTYPRTRMMTVSHEELEEI